MKHALEAMLALQDRMNSKVHPDWRHQGFAWYRAIWTECAELMDHYGWKWWKKQTPDLAQIHLELVDIWHFALSIALQSADDVPAAAARLEAAWTQPPDADPDFRRIIEAMAEATLRDQALPIPLFRAAMDAVDLSFDALYRQYVGKNVLNFFRQDHGYKDGTYHKVWSGREDNAHLAEILDRLDASSEDFQGRVYEALEARYPR